LALGCQKKDTQNNHHHYDMASGGMTMPQTLTLDHVSPATRLLEKRRQMFEVQEALDAQKEEFARREEAFRRREEGLRQKDLELQESLIKFNKFLQENESKRNRADKRASEESRVRRQKEEEIVKLQAGLNTMRKEYTVLEEQLAKGIKYQTFLERMQMRYSEEYPEIMDLLKRHQTLTGANNDLISRQREHEQINEEERAKFASFTKQGKTNMLNYNNQIASLQKELENATAKAAEGADLLDASIRKASAETLEVGQVLMAVKNLLQRCTSKQHGENLKHIDIKNQQDDGGHHVDHKKDGEDDAAGAALQLKGERAKGDLNIIAAYINDFRSIVNDYNKQERKRPRQQNSSPSAPTATSPTAAAAADVSKETKTGVLSES
jgi:hypothetical protein